MKHFIRNPILVAVLALTGTVMSTAIHAQGELPASAGAGEKNAQPSRAQQLMGAIAPKLAQLTDDVLYGDVWERPQLSKRDRSLVTVSALVAMNRTDQLRSHLALARQHGVTQEELVEAITQLAFYTGWPNAVSAISVAKEVFAKDTPVVSAPSNQAITITRADSLPTTVGAPENFTGVVRVSSRFQREAPARAAGGIVSFEPGARTAWHSHPLGQTLIVTSGTGRVQHWGGKVQTIKPGDIVWIPPGVKHWHGATATEGMTHIAITESMNGKTTDWMEQVTAEQYAAK